MRVIGTEKLPIKMWLDTIEDGALAQLKNLANFPFAFKHVAVMPDCHQGYGMPIGGVLATKDVIIPNAVGVDIGCGMCATRTSLRYADTSVDTFKEMMGCIRRAVPVGFGHHTEKQSEAYMPIRDMAIGITAQQYESARSQVGTLGGGNHFIELQRDTEGFVWVMIHSGSRNLGYKVANHYNDIAVRLNAWWHSSVPAEHELAFLPLGSEEGVLYQREMEYCVKFAYANRQLMIDRVLGAMYGVVSFAVDPMINIAHNYARMENHFGHNVMVHRKGATSARAGEIGIIPGSQGTNSYIVRGVGNEDSFMSCSHGAGRRMGRKQAERELVLEDEQRLLDDKGIIHSVRTKADLDEASGAYKNIHDVMASQSELVEIVTELTPIGVIKG